jgi:hypothetical protein
MLFTLYSVGLGGGQNPAENAGNPGKKQAEETNNRRRTNLHSFARKTSRLFFFLCIPMIIVCFLYLHAFSSGALCKNTLELSYPQQDLLFIFLLSLFFWSVCLCENDKQKRKWRKKQQQTKQLLFLFFWMYRTRIWNRASLLRRW